MEVSRRNKIVEVEGKAPDGKPNKTYNMSPGLEKTDFDDSKWAVSRGSRL